MLPLDSSNFRKVYKYAKVKKEMEDNNTPKFGPPLIVDHQAKYLDGYVVLSPMSNPTVSGKLIQITQGYFVLNPFQSRRLEKGIWKSYLKDRLPGRSIPIVNTGIEPETLEEIEGYFESEYKAISLAMNKQANKKESFLISFLQKVMPKKKNSISLENQIA
jgi:hypothetical protein